MNNYARNYKVATQKAANICNVPVEEVRANYRKVNNAPKGVKRATILAHRIMKGYDKAPVTDSTYDELFETIENA